MKPLDSERSAKRLLATVAVVAGSALGLGTFTVVYADAPSYLVDNPSSCANCHVMQGHLDAWAKSSHGKFAGCNDCHTSHVNIFAKYASKARNGFFHSLAFTTGWHPQNIRINDFNRGITEAACRSCHSAMIEAIDASAGEPATAEALECIGCHSTVGHDR